jgi:hypothetical protein
MSGSGMLATRTTSFAWSGESPASAAASFRVSEIGESSPLFPLFFPWPFSISFSSSPARRDARAERTAQPARRTGQLGHQVRGAIA